MPNIRKTTIPVKKLPGIASWILENCTGEQLDYLDRLSRSDLRTFVGIIDKFKLYNMGQVFNYKTNDDHELAMYRAACRGEVTAFDALLYVIQAARIEKGERRKRKG